MSKPRISVIIVHYKAQHEVLRCIQSIAKYEPDTELEILVVNNEPDQTLSGLKNETHHSVRILEMGENVGFGAACNAGALQAKGEYLFFLNPDTELRNSALSKVVAFLREHQEYGAVAPLLLDPGGTPYSKQGSQQFNFFTFVVHESVLGKLMRWIGLEYDHFLTHRNDDAVKEVSVVPGSAFAIKTEYFEELGGFDQQFFLFHEDLDLCHRIEESGKQLAILGEAKVLHNWGVSVAKDQKKAYRYFLVSRKRYAQKYFGRVAGTIAYYLVSWHWSVWVAVLLVGMVLGGTLL